MTYPDPSPERLSQRWSAVHGGAGEAIRCLRGVMGNSVAADGSRETPAPLSTGVSAQLSSFGLNENTFFYTRIEVRGAGAFDFNVLIPGGVDWESRAPVVAEAPTVTGTVRVFASTKVTDPRVMLVGLLPLKISHLIYIMALKRLIFTFLNAKMTWKLQRHYLIQCLIGQRHAVWTQWSAQREWVHWMDMDY